MFTRPRISNVTPPVASGFRLGGLLGSDRKVENSDLGAVNDCEVLELNQHFLWPQPSEFWRWSTQIWRLERFGMGQSHDFHWVSMFDRMNVHLLATWCLPGCPSSHVSRFVTGKDGLYEWNLLDIWYIYNYIYILEKTLIIATLQGISPHPWVKLGGVDLFNYVLNSCGNVTNNQKLVDTVEDALWFPQGLERSGIYLKPPVSHSQTQWIGLRENRNRKPQETIDFPMNYGVFRLKISLEPIHWKTVGPLRSSPGEASARPGVRLSFRMRLWLQIGGFHVILSCLYMGNIWVIYG